VEVTSGEGTSLGADCISDASSTAFSYGFWIILNSDDSLQRITAGVIQSKKVLALTM
jgi:hypothetical protein